MEAGPLRDALTLLLGLVTGVLSALFGIGGAIVSNPGLRALGAAPLVAVGTTLPSILPGAVSGTLRYQRERMIVWWVVIPAAAAGLPAVVGGSLLSHAVPGDGHLLLLLIAILLAFTAWRTAIPRPSPPPNAQAAGPDPGAAPGPRGAVDNPEPPASPSATLPLRGASQPEVGLSRADREGNGGADREGDGGADREGDGGADREGDGGADREGNGGAEAGATNGDPAAGGDPGGTGGDPVPTASGGTGRRGRWMAGGIGLAAGLLSGLLGIGGGVIMVPAFTELLGLSLKTAIATSLVCVGIFGIPATVAHALLGDIDWRMAALLAVAVVPGARVGASLTIRTAERRLRLAVGVFLALVAVVYFVTETRALLEQL